MRFIRLDFKGREKERGITPLSRLESEAVVDVLGDNGTVPGFEQVHISYRALGCLAAAPYIIFWSHALEVDVPAVELALRHDELWGEGRLGIDDGGLGLLLRTGRSGFSLFVFCGFGGFLCHDFEVLGV